jgi:hypothetical protein
VPRLGSPCPRSGPAPWASRGGGASRSKAAGELTLGLLSGEERKLDADLLYVGAGLLAKLLILPLPLFWLWLWLWLLILICLPLSQRPNAGVAQGAPRQGCRGSRPRPWMADGGGPPEQCRSEGMPSLGEAPNGGAKPFGSFLAFEKGTRCKSETVISHHRRNGYLPGP